MRCEESTGDIDGGVNYVLTIVQNEQRLSAFKCCRQRIERREAETARKRIIKVYIVKGREAGEQDTGPGLKRRFGNRGFTHAAWTHQRDEPMLS